MSDKQLDKVMFWKDFETLDDMQVAATFIGRYMMCNYGNMIYLERVDRIVERGYVDRYIGHLSCARNVKDGDGWKHAPPIRQVGTVEVDMMLRVIKASTWEEILAVIDEHKEDEVSE